MRDYIDKAGVAVAGLITSVVTAFAVALFANLTGFNLFTLSVLVVIPVGAGLCGFAAASGYYFAAKYLHQRPTKMLLVQMVVIAAFTQWLIYWLEYQTLVIDGVSISDVATFGQYMDATLTTAHMKLGRGLHADAGEVGTFGYWLAFFDFIGFLLGGAFVYLYLKEQPACPDCDKYFRSVATKGDSFPDTDEFSAYFYNVYANPVDSPEFAEHVGRDYSAGDAEQGTINLTTTVFECPQCFGQLVRETVQVFNGKEWKDVNDLRRFVAIPKGVDVRPLSSPGRSRGWSF